MKIEFNLGKRNLILLVGLLMFVFAAIAGVAALGNSWHLVNELDWTKTLMGNLSADQWVFTNSLEARDLLCMGSGASRVCKNAAEFAATGSGTSVWQATTGGIYYLSKVGINKQNPVEALDVNGAIIIRKGDSLCIGNACKSSWGTPSCPSGKVIRSINFTDNKVVCADPITGECVVDGDCGLDEWIGNPSCSGNSVTQTLKKYTCMNSGTQGSYCTSSESSGAVRESCSGGLSCSNGDCIKTCTTASDCGVSGQQVGFRTCYRGTAVMATLSKQWSCVNSACVFSLAKRCTNNLGQQVDCESGFSNIRCSGGITGNAVFTL